MVVADPEGHRLRRVFDEHSADVRLSAAAGTRDLPVFGLSANHAIGESLRPTLRRFCRRSHRRARIRRRRGPFLERLVLRSNIPMRSPRFSPNQKRPSESIMPRRGAGRCVGVSIDRDLAGLRVDSSDVLAAEHGEVPIVLRVGNHLVDVGTRNLEGSKTSNFPENIQAKHGVGSCILQPDLAVDFMMICAHLIYLNVIAVQFGRKLPRLKLFRSPVELRDAALKLHSHPEVFILIEAEGENPRRHLRL